MSSFETHQSFYLYFRIRLFEIMSPFISLDAPLPAAFLKIFRSCSLAEGNRLRINQNSSFCLLLIHANSFLFTSGLGCSVLCHHALASMHVYQGHLLCIHRKVILRITMKYDFIILYSSFQLVKCCVRGLDQTPSPQVLTFAQVKSPKI